VVFPLRDQYNNCLCGQGFTLASEIFNAKLTENETEDRMRTTFNRRLSLMLAPLCTSLLSRNALEQNGMKDRIEKLGQPYIDSGTVAGM
jgi:hypothetical protein